MTVIAAGTNLNQVLEQAGFVAASEGERFILLRLPNEDADAFQDYLVGLEADRILRETEPSDWVSFSELDKYREEAIKNGEVELSNDSL